LPTKKRGRSLVDRLNGEDQLRSRHTIMEEERGESKSRAIEKRKRKAFKSLSTCNLREESGEGEEGLEQLFSKRLRIE